MSIDIQKEVITMTATSSGSISEEVLERIIRWALTLYAPQYRLPYHGEPHPHIVWGRADRIMGVVEQLGIPVNRSVVKTAAFVHDAGYPFNHQVIQVNPGNGFQGCQSKERMTSLLVMAGLRQFGLPDEFIRAVGYAVDGSNPEGSIDTLEAKILRAADLGGLMQGYEGFSKDWEALRIESAIAQGKPEVDPITFARGVVAYLNLFLMVRIELTPHYYDANGASAFHAIALGNIIRKLHDVWGEGNLRVVGEFGCGRMPAPVDMPELFDPNTLYLGTDIGVRDLHCAHEQLKAANKLSPQHHPMCLLIPGEKKGISFPTGCLDTMVVRNGFKDIRWTGFPLINLVRPLKRGGRMIVIETYRPDGASRTGYNEPLNRYLVKTQIEGLGLTHIATTPVPTGGWRMEFVKN